MYCEACNAPLKGAQIDTGICGRCATEIHYAATESLPAPSPIIYGLNTGGRYRHQSGSGNPGGTA